MLQISSKAYEIGKSSKLESDLKQKSTDSYEIGFAYFKDPKPLWISICICSLSLRLSQASKVFNNHRKGCGLLLLGLPGMFPYSKVHKKGWDFSLLLTMQADPLCLLGFSCLKFWTAERERELSRCQALLFFGFSSFPSLAFSTLHSVLSQSAPRILGHLENAWFSSWYLFASHPEIVQLILCNPGDFLWKAEKTCSLFIYLFAGFFNQPSTLLL